MPLSGQQRSARHRAKLNAEPLKKEECLAKRRASYQQRKSSGRKEHPSINDLNTTETAKRRSIWWKAQEKQRDQKKILKEVLNLTPESFDMTPSIDVPPVVPPAVELPNALLVPLTPDGELPCAASTPEREPPLIEKKKLALERKRAVIQFLSRDENSRLLPGRKDTALLQADPRPGGTMSQPQAQAGPMVDPQEGVFWLGKAVAWDQADSPETQRDTCLHLDRLKTFLQKLLAHMNTMSSTSETMRRLSFVGQLLGRLCWNPYVTADAESRTLLFQSLWSLYSEEPHTPVETKANQWIRKLLCQLTTEAEDGAIHVLLKHMGLPPTEYHVNVLRKLVSVSVEEVGEKCLSLDNLNKRCSCDSALAASVVCVSLVTCPEAAPLIGALLQRPVTCGRAAFSQVFLDAVSSAHSRGRLSLDDQAVVSLWCHNLPTLEGAVLSLLESLLTNPSCIPQNLEQQLIHSLLPKACAQNVPVFLVVNDIFRSMLMQVEGNQALLCLIHTFTFCFLRDLRTLQSTECVSFKAFFPHTPQSLLGPLLTHSSEMPQEAWRGHLDWVSRSLQRLSEEEEGEDEGSGSCCGVFESWFLLVQCGHWVEVAVQLLVSAGPGLENSEPLLWLLTFYHHPTNRGHHRTLQLVAAREAWDHLRSLFLVSAPSCLPAEHLQSLVKLLVARPQQPSLAPLLVLSLLVNFAVFSNHPLGVAMEIVRTVVEQSQLGHEAVCVLSSVELRLNRGSCSSSDAHSRVHPRLRALQDTLTETHPPLQ